MSLLIKLPLSEPPPYTPMHSAAEGGSVDVMEWLFERNANVNNVSKHWTALSNACFSGQTEAVKWLLAHGANISLGRLPYHAAARGGHVELMKWMKDNHLHSPKSSNGWTAMHSAALGNQLPAMEWLLMQGEGIETKNKDGLTPLYAAAMTASLDAMKWLEQKGADVSVVTRNNETLMHAAAASGGLSVMEWLLSRGLSVNALTKYKQTPLCRAVAGERYTSVLKRTGNLEVAKWLLDHGAVSRGRQTPYLEAVKQGDLEIIRWLEANNFRDDYLRGRNPRGGWIAMHLAAQSGNTDVMEHLLTLGETVNVVCVQGSGAKRRFFTPLGEAVKYGNLDAAKWLYDHGAVYVRRIKPLFYLAAQSGHIKVMDWLLQHHWRCYRTLDGSTPMHAAAASYDKIETMEFLLKLGDDVNAVDKSGRTPLDIAMECKHKKIAKWLQSQGAVPNSKPGY